MNRTVFVQFFIVRKGAVVHLTIQVCDLFQATPTDTKACYLFRLKLLHSSRNSSCILVS